MGVLLEMTVEGEPVAWQRTRGSGNRRFTPPKTRQWETTVGLFARRWRTVREPHGGEVAVSLTFRRSNARRADIDNLTKAVLDAMNGIVYDDDAQVTALCVGLERRSDSPGVDITVVEQ